MQGDQRVAGVARGERDGAACVGRHRAQPPARALTGQLAELERGLPGRGDVADREQDVDGRRQEVGAQAGLGRGRQHPPDRGVGEVRPALPEPQAGEARLRLAPVSARGPVRRLGRDRVAPQAVELALAVEGLGGGVAVAGRERALAGPARLLERVGPGAAQLHELGAVDEAPAREGHEVLLARAPVRQHLGPLLRPADVLGRAAGQDHAAVDDPRHDRRELAAGDREHRLVQQRDALPDVARQHEDVALLVPGERDEVGLPEVLADRGRLRERRHGGADLAARLLLEGDREEQVAAFHVSLAGPVEQPLRAAEPAAGPAQLALAGERDADPAGAPQRPHLAAVGEVELVRALEEPQVIGLPPEHVGAGGEPLGVLRGQVTGLVCGREGPLGVLPRRAGEGLPPPLEVGDGSIHHGEYRATAGDRS